jgi:thioredoxin reductase (NADPH)
MENWDIIIVGAGSAGCAAAIYAVRSGLKTLVLDEKFAGGTIADAPTIVNYPGYPSISGSELAQKMADHARGLGAVIHDIEAVTTLNLSGENKTVTTNAATYTTKAVIIATGSHYKEIGAKGEKEFRGRGVSYCGVCDGPFFKKKNVLVVGGGNSACTTTLYLSGLANQVTVVHRRE